MFKAWQVACAIVLCCKILQAQSTEEVPTGRLCDYTEETLEAASGAGCSVEEPISKAVVRWGMANVGQPVASPTVAQELAELQEIHASWRLSTCSNTALIEQLYSLASGHSADDAKAVLTHLRFRNGVIAAQNRNLCIVASWAENNRWLFDDITDTLGGGMVWIPFHRIVDYEEPIRQTYGIVVRVPSEKYVDGFIPRVYLQEVLPELQDGDLAIRIDGDSRQQVGAGLGIVRRDQLGEIRIVYAAETAVQEESLTRYTYLQKTILGYKFLRLRSDTREQIARLRTGEPMANDPARGNSVSGIAVFRQTGRYRLLDPRGAWGHETPTANDLPATPGHLGRRE